MSDTIQKNCGCPSPEIVAVPGAQGATGSAGANGTNGTNGTNGSDAFSTTTANFVIPATGSTVAVSVSGTAWNVVGQNVFVSDGTKLANFQVTGIQASPPQLTLKALGYNGDSAAGQTISSAALVSPGGTQGFTAPVSIANGGTNAITAAAARTSLGVPAQSSTGTFVCNGVTPVTVTDANVTANSLVLVTLKTVGGTVGAIPAVKTITVGTGFTIAGTASDISTYNYLIIN